jgi:hypothetical protein
MHEVNSSSRTYNEAVQIQLTLEACNLAELEKLGQHARQFVGSVHDETTTVRLPRYDIAVVSQSREHLIESNWERRRYEHECKDVARTW